MEELKVGRMMASCRHFIETWGQVLFVSFLFLKSTHARVTPSKVEEDQLHQVVACYLGLTHFVFTSFYLPHSEVQLLPDPAGPRLGFYVFDKEIHFAGQKAKSDSTEILYCSLIEEVQRGMNPKPHRNLSTTQKSVYLLKFVRKSHPIEYMVYSLDTQGRHPSLDVSDEVLEGDTSDYLLLNCHSNKQKNQELGAHLKRLTEESLVKVTQKIQEEPFDWIRFSVESRVRAAKFRNSADILNLLQKIKDVKLPATIERYKSEISKVFEQSAIGTDLEKRVLIEEIRKISPEPRYLPDKRRRALTALKVCAKIPEFTTTALDQCHRIDPALPKGTCNSGDTEENLQGSRQ